MTQPANNTTISANILIAINNFEKLSSLKLKLGSKSKNRVNSVGDSLEIFVIDLFCSTLDEMPERERQLKYSQILSYLGNQNNPPDFMIRGGDAVEVKKFSKLPGTIPLNSSAPKSKLHSSDRKIIKSCVEAESWSVKDIIYSIGIVSDNLIDSVFMVYGDCFAASKEIYQSVEDRIRESIDSDSETKELGAIKKFDPLGVTNLRVRGMWAIKNPYHIFKEILEPNARLHSLMRKDKFLSFPEAARNKITHSKTVEIRNPDNPAQLIEAIYIWVAK